MLPPLPLDLHVLSLSLAFILSQDQTLRCCYIFYYFFSAVRRPDKLTAGRSLRLTEGSRPLPSSCILSHYFNVLFHFSAPRFSRVASANLSRNFEPCKSFCKFFQNFFRRAPSGTWPPLRYRRFSFCECKGTYFTLTLQIFLPLFQQNFTGIYKYTHINYLSNSPFGRRS